MRFVLAVFVLFGMAAAHADDQANIESVKQMKAMLFGNVAGDGVLELNYQGKDAHGQMCHVHIEQWQGSVGVDISRNIHPDEGNFVWFNMDRSSEKTLSPRFKYFEDGVELETKTVHSNPSERWESDSRVTLKLVPGSPEGLTGVEIFDSLQWRQRNRRADCSDLKLIPASVMELAGTRIARATDSGTWGLSGRDGVRYSAKELINAFINSSGRGDVNEFRFVENAEEIPRGEKVAGTLKTAAAIRILKAEAQRRATIDKALAAQMIDQAVASLRTLRVQYGYIGQDLIVTDGNRLVIFTH